MLTRVVGSVLERLKARSGVAGLEGLFPSFACGALKRHPADLRASYWFAKLVGHPFDLSCYVRAQAPFLEPRSSRYISIPVNDEICALESLSADQVDQLLVSVDLSCAAKFCREESKHDVDGFMLREILKDSSEGIYI